MTHGLWNWRWGRAAIVAVALAGWPACAVDRTSSGAAANLKYVLKDADGKDVNLAAFAGRPLLLNFWATWCAPCRAETPWFSEFAEKYSSQNLAVIGISVERDDSPADIKEFAATYKATYPLLVGGGQADLIAAYDAVDIIPVTWLIRADGTVHMKVKGMHQKDWFESQLQAMF